MKNLKKFEDWSKYRPMEYTMDNEDENWEQNIDNYTFELPDNITPESFKIILKECDDIQDIFEKTQKYMDILEKYPFVKGDANFKEIWWEHIKKWYKEISDAKLSEEDDKIIQDITKGKYRYEK